MSNDDFIDKLLENVPDGKSLLAEVRDFYGPALSIVRHDEDDGVSHFHIDVGAGSLQFRGATIELNTTSSRAKAGAMHELFHLHLPIKGFPVLDGFKANQDIDESLIEKISEAINSVMNVTQHYVFLEEFLAAGFPLSDFLAPSKNFFDYEAEARKKDKFIIPPGSDWWLASWWLVEYFSAQSGIPHGVVAAEDKTRHIMKYGMRVIPSLKSSAASIQRLLETKSFSSPQGYAEFVAQLWGLLKFPLTPKFVRLSAKKGAPPTVQHF